MISKLILENYEGHQDSHFEFVPGINALTGDSDNGKSSIIRAIEWVRTNKPLGDAHISDWIMKTSKKSPGGLKPTRTIMAEKQCAVTIEKDGHEIQRCRSTKFNGYYIDHAFNSPLEAMGSELPTDVINFFNVDEVNVQRQRSVAFLIDSPPPEAARFLNRLVKLTDIDDYTSIAESKRRATNKELAEKRELVADLESQLNTYLWVDKLRPIVLQLESFKASIDTTNHKIDDLMGSLSRYDQLKAAAERLHQVLAPIKHLASMAQNTHELVAVASRKCAELQPQLQQWKKYQEICKNKPILGTISERMSEALNVRTPLLNHKIQIDQMVQQLNQWKTLATEQVKTPIVIAAESKLIRATRMLSSLTETNTNIQHWNHQLRVYTTLLDTHSKLSTEIPKLLAGLPKMCPLCGGPLHMDYRHES